MMRMRWFAPGLALVAALSLASCDATSPTGVAPPNDVSATMPSAELLGFSLLGCSPLDADSASALIGPEGGSIQVGPHRFSVPAGALDSAVLITATIASESINRVRFAPDGLQFAESATLTMSTANCGILAWLFPQRIVYVDSGLNILAVLPALDGLLSHTTTARIDHFSDYAVAW